MRKIFLIFLFFFACVSWADDCEIITRNGASSSNCGDGGSSWLWNNRSPTGCTKNTCPSSYGYCCELQECNDNQTVWAKCRTQCQLDSLKCESPNVWNSDSCRCEERCEELICAPDETWNDSLCQCVRCDTTWECIDYAPRERCIDVPSNGQIVCTSNGCSGLPYSKWWSEHERECTNECGDKKTETETTDTLVTFDATCDDSTRCSDETYCVDVGGKYIVYQKCQVGNSQVGNNQSNRTLAEIVESGSGSCAQHNYNSNNVSNPNSNNQNSPNDNNQNPIQDSISNDCLVYGVNCPEKWTDTTDYSLDDNKSPDNGCICESGSGLRYITCPDGSITAEFGNCSDWRKSFSSSSFSSSSNPPEPTSSGSENPQSSSGGVSDMAAMFERNFKEMKNALLGIAENTKETSNGINQQNSPSVNGSKTGTATIENAMDSYTVAVNDSTPLMRVPDSMLVARDSLDTSFIHHIFDKVNENNTILDTIPNVGFSGCPCVTFFQGNATNHIENGVWRFKEIKIDFSSVYGVNLCTVISTIVVALASVVSFFIGFAIFKNVSQ